MYVYVRIELCLSLRSAFPSFVGWPGLNLLPALSKLHISEEEKGRKEKKTRQFPFLFFASGFFFLLPFSLGAWPGRWSEITFHGRPQTTQSSKLQEIAAKRKKERKRRSQKETCVSPLALFPYNSVSVTASKHRALSRFLFLLEKRQHRSGAGLLPPPPLLFFFCSAMRLFFPFLHPEREELLSLRCCCFLTLFFLISGKLFFL